MHVQCKHVRRVCTAYAYARPGALGLRGGARRGVARLHARAAPYRRRAAAAGAPPLRRAARRLRRVDRVARRRHRAARAPLGGGRGGGARRQGGGRRRRARVGSGEGRGGRAQKARPLLGRVLRLLTAGRHHTFLDASLYSDDLCAQPGPGAGRGAFGVGLLGWAAGSPVPVAIPRALPLGAGSATTCRVVSSVTYSIDQKFSSFFCGLRSFFHSLSTRRPGTASFLSLEET
eukprot:scaffold8426_cov61-Phaeocystis_antarctica.AAC.2